tara:strand:- start:265 stop:1566 length:1302 start_codon:yes stop_codon:yes gene_type:complete
MTPVWRRELRRISLLLIITFALDYFTGLHGWSVVAVLVCYIGWNMLQLSRLYRWLASGQIDSLPSSYGIWGSVFAETRRLQNRSLKHQQKLQAIINRIQDSTAALQDAVLMVDSHGNLEWWNQAAQRFLGLKSPVDVGQPITNLIRDPSFKAYFDQADYSDPLTMASPVNKHIHLQFNITQFGRRDRLMLVHDVTRLKQLEQMRKDFVANVSHELRTPLTVLAGYIETMDMNSDILPERWQRMLKQMGSQSLRMEAIIKDLLTLSRLETSAKEHPAQVQIQPLLEQIAADARALSQGRGHTITLSTEGPVALLGYTDELRSAFSNLAFNAVKYTPDGGHIELIWREREGRAEFCVKDDGVGIADHHIPRLTERFYRADPSRSKETGGTGLGLAIVKHVLLRHDGELYIESTPGKGSCFCCRFNAQSVITELAS